ncbi:hypothetical protein FEMY_22420 [Ferrovum myxofaciens]|uniref:Transmembrane protein n=1 Tax=Ferrovum myxofaciens TaxID=416213 RepID=A0A149VVJ0_9PROT|nr:hypothetical protein FEMY_22420 [Ferrovum myxofaciens]
MYKLCTQGRNPVTKPYPYITDERSNEKITALIYALYAASFLVGITAIAAIMMNYIKREDVAGTYLESHFRWQIRTFWFAMMYSSIGIVLLLILIGWPILIATGFWVIYRITKGWLRLFDRRAMYG